MKFAMILLLIPFFASAETSFISAQKIEKKEIVSKSQFFRQVPEDSVELQLSPISGYSNVKTESETNLESYYGFAVSLSGGLENQQELSFKTSLANAFLKEDDQEYKFSGLSDFHLQYQKLVNRKNGHLVLGLSAFLSPGAKTGANEDVTGSRNSGGNSILPSIGLENAKSAGGAYGFDLSYRLKDKRKIEFKDNNGYVYSERNYSGGNIIKLHGFNEFKTAGQSTIGLSAGIKHEESSEREETGYRFDPLSYASVGAYFANKTSEGFEFAPSINYETLLTRQADGTTYESYDNIDLFLGFRMSL